MIEVKNLVKDYGGHVAVDHLNFTVEDGFIYGFLGPNGAGKSTTMNMMTGYLGATEGEIIIEGHNILEEPKKAKQCIGYLPEIPPLYVDMTVTEYLEFAAKLKGIPKKERKEEIERAVQVTKLGDVCHRLIRNLSKGYKQRVGLAQAILGMPPVIILDEPTVGLDPKQIIEIRDLIKELGKQHTVILSSHILSEVQAVCDKIMIISHGRLVASDTPENLEKMAGTYGMELTVKTEVDTAAEILGKLKEYDSMKNLMIRPIENSEETGISFQLGQENDGGQDIRETLFFAFAKERIPILEMKEKKMSLEDVFLELTSDKTDAAVTEEFELEEFTEEADFTEEAESTEEADFKGETNLTEEADFPKEAESTEEADIESMEEKIPEEWKATEQVPDEDIIKTKETTITEEAEQTIETEQIVETKQIIELNPITSTDNFQEEEASHDSDL